MKKLLLIFLILTWSAATVNAQYFEVWIHQYNKQVPIQNNMVTLESAPFEIVIYMSEPMGVGMAASFYSESYDLALRNAPLDRIVPFQEGRRMPSQNFNPLKQIEVDDEAHSYFYYNNANEHSFDNILPYEPGGFHTYYMVEDIFSNEGNFTTEEMGSKSIYLVFLLSKWINEKQSELGKQPLVLTFR